VTTHEAFRREQVVMGMVKDGRVVFGNEADRARLIKSATSATPAKVKAKAKTK
jgi:branched-chain amino acid transport system substrate-binding protein